MLFLVARSARIALVERVYGCSMDDKRPLGGKLVSANSMSGQRGCLLVRRPLYPGWCTCLWLCERTRVSHHAQIRLCPVIFLSARPKTESLAARKAVLGPPWNIRTRQSFVHRSNPITKNATTHPATDHGGLPSDDSTPHHCRCPTKVLQYIA